MREYRHTCTNCEAKTVFYLTEGVDMKEKETMVPSAGIEPALPKEPDFESGASTNSARRAGSEGGLYHGLKRNDKAHRQLNFKESLDCEFPDSAIQMKGRLFAMWCIIEVPYGWALDFKYDTRGYWYLQIADPNDKCNVTGEPYPWTGRKWLISEHMTDGEIVQTAFKAVMTAVEHETREKFLWRDQPIFDPHYDIDKLAVMRGQWGALKVRGTRGDTLITDDLLNAS